jgi:RimJ/RimL family protein N-acetyltransferase
VGLTLDNNKKSERILQKLGFTFEENIVLAGMPHILYRYQNPN